MLLPETPFEDCLAARQSWQIDALHWVVAAWLGFTTDSVKSTTAFSATFVAVRALRGAVLNKTQFACCTGYRAYPHYSLCARDTRVLAAAAAVGV